MKRSQIVTGDYWVGEALVLSKIDSVTGSVSTGKAKELKKTCIIVGRKRPLYCLRGCRSKSYRDSSGSCEFVKYWPKLHRSKKIHSREGTCRKIYKIIVQSIKEEILLWQRWSSAHLNIVSAISRYMVLSISSSVTNSTCCSSTRTENQYWLFVVWTRFPRINKGSIITIYNSCFSSLLWSW
jgi:hypothetical protein